MVTFRPREEHRERFERDGYVVVDELLDAEETDLLARVAAADHGADDHALERRDATGTVTRLTLFNDLPDDLYGTIVRSERIVRAMEAFLGGEVCHYHHKIMFKDPGKGGAWEWHQDYGYWYRNGCLFPDMGSCMIAIDEATRENGCLQVLPGSHRLGRLDHHKVGDQTAADPQRMAHVLRRFEPVPVEMAPGAGLFFHANLIHRSDRNRSAAPRTSLICCYNTAWNDPFLDHHHRRYEPLEVVPDARVRAVGRASIAAPDETTP